MKLKVPTQTELDAMRAALIEKLVVTDELTAQEVSNLYNKYCTDKVPTPYQLAKRQLRKDKLSRTLLGRVVSTVKASYQEAKDEIDVEDAQSWDDLD